MPINNFLSKIKKLVSIKKEGQGYEREKQSQEEIQLSKSAVNKAKQFLVKYGPYMLIIVPIIITIVVRYQSIGLTMADDWAAGNVYNYYQSQIRDQIEKQYPNLQKADLESRVANQLDKFVMDNRKEVEEQIKSVAQQYRGFLQYESGSHSYPYMGDIDSYYWLRQAKNIVEKGHNCDVIENGKCYDTYTLAPEKVNLPKSLHPYSIAFFYKALKPFNKDLTLMQTQIMVPAIFAVIIAILTYVIMLRLSGALAAITSSILISVNPLFLSRSIGSDNDIYNILLPILIVFIAFKSFNAKGLKAKSIFSSMLGLSVGAYSFAWGGWWYLFDFILVSIILDYCIFVAKELHNSKKIAINELIKSQKTKEMLAVLLPFFIVSMIAVAMFSGIGSLNPIYSGFLSFTKSKAAANPGIWPNVLTTVAEFNESSLSEIIQQSWGKWFFFFALLGFIILVYKTLKAMVKNWMLSIPSISVLYYLVTSKGTSLKPVTYIMLFSIPFIIALYFAFKSEESVDIRFSILFFLWTASSIYAATKGVRFILLMVLPVSIGIGVTLGFFHRSGTHLIASLTKLNKALVGIILFLALSFFLINPVEAGISTSKNYLPNVNDNWWNALTKIKENSKPDAIINSWWDFGHWFKYIADRRVTLDGSSQNHPQLHWLGKLLLASDEKEAVGILRMLDCGGNQAFNSINKKKNDTPKSIGILNKIILIEKRDEAKNILADEGFSEYDSEKVLNYTHCEPPEDFLITSEDMVGKSGVWAHFGSWDFGKAWMHKAFDSNKGKDKTVKMFMEEFNYSKETANGYYSEIESLKSDSDINAWIAPWPSYMGETSCQNKENFVICPFQQGSVGVNLTSMEAYIPTSEGVKSPAMFGYTTPSGINVKEYSTNTIGIGFVLRISNGSYSSIFMSPQLVNSTFTKLYYLDGHGTSYFGLFHESSGSNLDIKVWKVNWKGSDKPMLVEKFV